MRETGRTAFRSLRANRLRTALTGLGMVIGVAAVVAVLAIGEGARESIEGQVRSLGSNLLVVRAGAASMGGIRGGNVTTLTRADGDALRGLRGVSAVSPEANSMAQVRAHGENLSAGIVGVTPEYVRIRGLNVAMGLSFTPLDDTGRARVAILGANVARDLFLGRVPVGDRIQIRGVSFRVIGVLEEKGASFFSSDDNVLVPLSTHQGVLFGTRHVSTLSVQVESEGATEEVRERITQLLRLRHRIRPDEEEDFNIRAQTEMLATMREITGTLSALLVGVAAVSLLVGGIGIMNIMLVTVHERTREIGVRMAVGARRRDILLQFLFEAVVVSVFGGLLGLALGYALAIGIAELGGWTTMVPLYAVALSLAVSVGVGVLFGVGPARRASRLDPVDALRQE